MPLKTIAVFVDTTLSGKYRANYAAKLASRHGAHLTGIYIISTGVPESPKAHAVRGSSAIKEAISNQQAIDKNLTATASRRFENICREHGVATSFRSVPRGAPDRELRSLHPDLAIIGTRELYELPGFISPEGRLLKSRIPLFVIPNSWKSETVAQKVLVSWNGSAQARRAIADALPLLVAAKSVTVFVVDPVKTSASPSTQVGNDIALYLERHGVSAVVEQRTSQDASVAEVILSYAVEKAIDLVVIGAYSHPRLMQLMFGGVTRSLLKRLPVPLFMSR
jgi:nucleotide-binding universal stress UspA family protein